jgi:hypothetical protein
MCVNKPNTLKFKGAEVKKINDEHFCVEFYNKQNTFKIKLDQGGCYRLFRKLKEALNLQPIKQVEKA